MFTFYVFREKITGVKIMFKFQKREYLYISIGIIASIMALILRSAYTLDPQDTGFVAFVITLVSYNLLVGKLVRK